MFEWRHITILLIPEGGGKTYEFKMPRFVFWLLGLGVVAVIAMLVISFQAYSDVGYLRQRVVKLEDQKEALTENVELLVELETDLKALTRQNLKLRFLLAGRDGEQPDEEQISRSGGEPYVSALKRMQLGKIRTVPTMWPIRGVVTDSYGEELPAAIIAATVNSLVRASAAGWVDRAGFDETLGNLVVLNHTSGLKSLYGYAATILVNEGDYVHKGQAIALSGTSGDTGLPGLYFAVHENGRPRNPVGYMLWL
jgi:murein DD-endopeptidase MepM/ murein hydrolase activator NlpD